MTDESTIDSLAQQMGYNPDYDGDDAKTAEEFILDTQKINKQSSSDMIGLKSQVLSMQTQMQEMAINTGKQVNSALTAQRERLKEDQLKAVEEGNTEEYSRLGKQIDALKEPEAPTIDPRAQEMQASETAFSARNSWYNGVEPGNAAMTASAVAIAQSLAKSDPNLKGEDFFKRIEQEIEYKYPQAFAKPSNKPTGVAPDNPAPRSTSKSKWDQMLAEFPESKVIYLEFLKEGAFGKDKEDTKEKRETYAEGVMS